MKRILMVIVSTLFAHSVWARTDQGISHTILCQMSRFKRCKKPIGALISFPRQLPTSKELELWQDIVDQLNLQSMPPKRQMQPGKDEVLATVQVITASIAEARMRLSGKRQHTPLRRLNAWEYLPDHSAIYSV